MQYKEIILSHITDYLKIKKYKHEKLGKVVNLVCPFCKSASLTAQVIPGSYKIRCLNDHCLREGKKFTLISIVKRTEKDKKNWDNEKIIQYLKELLKINVITSEDKDKIEKLFKMYKENGWSLVPVKRNDKIPIEKEWTQKEHKDPKEWWEWINNGLNFGVRTGKVNNLTILDVDQKPIPKEIQEVMGETLIQKSTNGYHLYYQYEELPKCRINEFKIDIENDGGQVVITPSIVNGIPRKFINNNKVIKMPANLVKLLKEKTSKLTKQIQIEDIEKENFNLDLIEEGSRSDSLIRLAGLFRKRFNYHQTCKIVKSLNKHICLPPLDSNELERTVLTSIERYCNYDDDEIAKQILDYLKEAKSASKAEIEIAILENRAKGEERKRIDRTLVYLIKENLIIKRGREYELVERMDWSDTLIDVGTPINFKIPYLDDVAYFYKGDLIVLGAMNKKGKTILALNFLKRFVQQGLKPYYVYNEKQGGRFARDSLQLGLMEGDYYHTRCKNPQKLILEPEAITIYDWVKIKGDEFSRTADLFDDLVEKVEKTNGLLICFVQLKENNSFFAPNLIGQIPAILCKYLYENETDGTFTYFDVCNVRDAKRKGKNFKIPCRYNWDTKEVFRLDELEEVKSIEEPEQVLEDGKEED